MLAALGRIACLLDMDCFKYYFGTCVFFGFVTSDLYFISDFSRHRCIERLRRGADAFNIGLLIRKELHVSMKG